MGSFHSVPFHRPYALHHQLISLLPQRVLKLLEFIGFRGSRVSAIVWLMPFALYFWPSIVPLLMSPSISSSQAIGLRELERGYQLEGSIRRILCAISLLGYHLIIVYALGNGEGNLAQANAILEEQLKVRGSQSPLYISPN